MNLLNKSRGQGPKEESCQACEAGLSCPVGTQTQAKPNKQEEKWEHVILYPYQQKSKLKGLSPKAPCELHRYLIVLEGFLFSSVDHVFIIRGHTQIIAEGTERQLNET